jgi:tRNA(Ile2) C34 agmatinyltransferase TiaS
MHESRATNNEPRPEFFTCPPTEDLIASLRSTICPACGGAKKVKQTFCQYCYFDLPNAIRAHLYRLIGRGYEEALAEAMQHLTKTQFILPKEATNDHQ